MREFEHNNLLVVDESTQYIHRKRVELLEPQPSKRFSLLAAVWEGSGWHIERTRWSLREGILFISAAWVIRAV